MMNSLCGTLAPLKKERSSSKPESSSPTTSVSESNNIAASKELEQSASTSLNLNFEGLKFEVDPDEVQSPNNNSLWESLFGDHTDTCTDYMISSPRRTPDFMIYSPKRNTEYLLPTPRKNPFGDVRSNVQGPSALGNSPLSLSGAYGTAQKEKAQSPLQRVFPATNHFDSVGVPEHTDDYGRDSFGAYSTMKMTTGVSSSSENFNRPTTLGELFACSNLPSSSTFESFAEARVQEDLHMTQERNMYQMSSMASGQLHHEQKQPPQQLQQNLHHSILANESQQDKDSGLELVHLLLACAEAVAKEDYMEARKYLHHLNCVVTPLGDSMQRVASCFTDALGARLAATLTTSPNTLNPRTFTSSPSNSLEVLNMYQILYQACPYIKFAHFTANQAIFEAIEAEERVHIIDLNILQGYQWPAFMQALASRPNGSPFLRITGVGYPLEAVRDTGRCLAELADSLRIPFEFHPVGEHLEDLKPHMFHRRVGEALAVNSVNCLHRVPGNHLGYVLGMVRDQAPNIVTLVEQEANHNGPYFLGRFLEALHYYSAIFDSLDSTFPLDSAERAKVEQSVYAQEIRNIVACEGPERVERHERLEKWRKVMEGKGFRSVPLSPNAVTQSEILLGLYACEAYRLTEDRGCLLLGWQDRSLLASSAWRC